MVSEEKSNIPQEPQQTEVEDTQQAVLEDNQEITPQEPEDTSWEDSDQESTEVEEN